MPYYKSWTVDFFKVTNKRVSILKNEFCFGVFHLTYMFLLLQASLRQNSMIDSESRLWDVWPM